MRKIRILSLILLLATVVSAQTKTPNWVNVTPRAQSSTQTLLLDDANPITEDGFRGYNIRIVQPSAPFKTDSGFVGIIRLLIIEVNCTSGDGRGMRVGYEGENGTRENGDHIWRVIGSEPATILYTAVKNRTCR
jgi:hypothetical protein